MAAKGRSRNYPALGLGEAIQKAKDLYDRDGKATVSAEAAVQAWGYKGLNGASLRVLAAVRQYGLIENPAPKMVKLSRRALAILLDEPGSPERAAAIQEAANSPTIFAELQEQYPDGLPSDNAMVSHLVKNETFSEGAARDLIAAFRDTLSLAEKAANSDITPKKQGQAGGGQDERKDRTPPPKLENEGGRMEFNWPLSGGAVARLTVSRDLDPDDVETLAAYLEIAKRTLAKEAAKAERLGGRTLGDIPEVREAFEATLGGSARARNDTGH